MPYPEEYPTTPRRIQSGLPAASVMQEAGYPLDWFSKLKLGMAKLFGGLESLDALPSQVRGVPVQGRERMQDLVEFLRPFASRPNFGRNPQDAEDVLEAFTKRSLGLGDIEQERASKLLKVYRNAIARKGLEELGVFSPTEEPARGLMQIIQSRQAR
jgi:hypothetical protein